MLPNFVTASFCNKINNYKFPALILYLGGSRVIVSFSKIKTNNYIFFCEEHK